MDGLPELPGRRDTAVLFNLLEGPIFLFAGKGCRTVHVDVVDRIHDHAFEAISDDALKLDRSEEHTSELQSLMRISYAVFCLKKKKLQGSNSYTYQLTPLKYYTNQTHIYIIDLE